ncbi:MAG: GNAT family N-acetyltransferase [Kiritimatiellae bacterium]|nr:GNAT family N-acetyltransferase [Kiritimatiellia bacterium]
MNDSDLVIRAAAAADEAGIKELLKRTPGVWQKWWREAAVAKAMESAGATALVAVRHGKIIGFACFHDVGFRAYLSEMVIAESEQGNGIGSQLLKSAERLLADAGCQLIVADVYPPAEGFYAHNGWGKPKAVLMSKIIEKPNG